MKRLAQILLAASLLLPAPLLAAEEPAIPESDAEVAAHQSALDLAGAFGNDGFKLRDGHYTGVLKSGQSVVIETNLFAGNQYWFSVATAEPKSAVAISLYDESGKLVKTDDLTTAPQPGTDAAKSDDPSANSNRAAAGFAPDASGPSYLRLTETAGSSATFCLIYSYK